MLNKFFKLYFNKHCDICLRQVYFSLSLSVSCPCFTGKKLMPFIWIEMALLSADPLGVTWNTAPALCVCSLTICKQNALAEKDEQ